MEQLTDPLLWVIWAVITSVLTLLAVLAGFCMGWKAARPDDTLVKPKPFNPGPTDGEEEDVFREALTPYEDRGK